MTKSEKDLIAMFRSRGMGYKSIADKLGLNKEAVRSYCRYHGLTANSDPVCPQCGKPIVQTPGRKKRRFCSVVCRQTWWNAHPEAVQQKAVYSYTCIGCGCAFTAYGNDHRKYCSHACYIQDRFKARDEHDE